MHVANLFLLKNIENKLDIESFLCYVFLNAGNSLFIYKMGEIFVRKPE